VAPLASQLGQSSLGSGGPPSRALPSVPESAPQRPAGPPPALPTTARPHIASGSASSSTAAASDASPSPSSASAAAAAAAAIVRTNEAARLEMTRVVKEGYLKKLGAQVKNW
jgi:hypothetical protein